MSTLCITGWTSGLGESIVRHYIANDRKVIVLARNEKKLESLKSELWINFEYYVCDISNKNQLQNTFKEIIDIDCLINNSGIWYWETVYEESLDHIEDTIMTNLIGAIRCTRLALPIMMKQKNGIIINIGSIQATRWRIWASTYGASKAWLKMYSDILREEIKKENIKVISIHPWKIETPMRDDDELVEFKNRMLQPDQVTKIVYESCIQAMQWVVQEEIYIKPQWIIK